MNTIVIYKKFSMIPQNNIGPYSRLGDFFTVLIRHHAIEKFGYEIPKIIGKDSYPILLTNDVSRWASYSPWERNI